MKINAANGSYVPSYFYMQIESDEDIQTCIDNNEQTFVHEYIHFLQDLILPYNIRNTLIANENFTLICQSAYADKIIMKPFSKYDENSDVTGKQLHYTWGENKFIDQKEKIIKIDKQFFEMDNGVKVYGYILTTDQNTHYHVGARDLLEYIAHKIESKHWTVNHPVFPYMTVDLLFEYYSLDWVTDEVRICLVEFALYNDNPFNQLVFVLDNMVTTKPELFKSYELCKITLLNTRWNSNGGFSETIFSKTERRLRALNSSLNEKYINDNFKEIQKWIELIITFAKAELFGKFIFTELFCMNKNEFNEKIEFFIRQIGIPMIFNNKDECISLLPEQFNQNDFVPLYIANKFMEFTLSEENSCPVYSFCKTANRNMINERCITNPILRVSEEYLCPINFFIKSYGLHEIEWK